MASERNHPCIVPFFNNHSPPSRQFLRDKTLLKKISWEMLIEKVIEFELRGPGTHGHKRCQEVPRSRPN